MKIRYRFAVQFNEDSAGLGIERLKDGKISALWSIYVEDVNDWVASLSEVLNAEKEPFDVVCKQDLRPKEHKEITEAFIVKEDYANFRRLLSCRQLAADAGIRRTSISEKFPEGVKIQTKNNKGMEKC